MVTGQKAKIFLLIISYRISYEWDSFNWHDTIYKHHSTFNKKTKSLTKYL